MKIHNISTHISLLITAMLSLCLIILSLTIINIKNKDLKNTYQKDLESNLKLISTSISEPLFTFNDNSITSILNSFVNVWDHPILAAKIEDLDQKEIKVIYADGITADYNLLKNIDGHTENKTYIDYKNTHIGVLKIISSDFAYKKELKTWIYLFILYILLAIIVIFVLFKALLNRLLNKPLNQLIQEMSKLKANDFSAKIEGNFKFELDIIAHKFNESVDGIRERDSKILEYATLLEGMVEERTNERDEQSMKAFNASRMASIGEMSSGIAHEIGSPLTVISLLSVQIGKKLEEQPEAYKAELEKISKIKSMVVRIQKIIISLRRLARDGSVEKKNNFKLDELIDSIKDITNHKLITSNIDLVIENKSEHNFIWGQEIQISQVIINLLNNSIDAISELEKKWIKFEIFDRDDFIYFSITDSGFGIPEEVVEKMLNPFFTTKEKGKGTGLGLSISKNIIKDHGGDLYYKKNNGNTQFLFYIKWAESE